MKNSSTAFVGLDVHKNSIDIAIAEADLTGKIRLYGTVGGDLDSSSKAVRKLRSRHANLTKPVPATMRSTAIFAVRGCPMMSLLLH